MSKLSLSILFLLLSPGCLNQKGDVEYYLRNVQIEMKALSEDLNAYFTARALYNNGTLDAIEAYDNAVMAAMKNRETLERIKDITPPKDFEVFHSLVISSAENIGLAYQYDMDCLKSEKNTSCESAKDAVRLARELSDNATYELESLGVAVY